MDNTVIVPYNFVPLQNEKGPVRKSSEEWTKENSEEIISGIIHCTLKTKTPLIIPNTSYSPNNKEEFYDFYSYKNFGEAPKEDKYYEPVIPGSSIKGMMRSYFEAIHDGCLSSVDKDKKMVKRTEMGEAGNCKPCIIEKDDVSQKWKLYDAKQYGLYVHDNLYGKKKDMDYKDAEYGSMKEGDLVEFSNSKKYKKKLKSNKEIPILDVIVKNGCGEKKTGYYHKSEKFGNKKHFERVFVKKNENESNVLSQETINAYKKFIEDKIEEKKKKNETGHLEGYLKFLEGDNRILCYYEKVAGEYYLRYSQIGAELQHNTLEKSLMDYEPCTDEKICSSCYLFGMLSENKAIASSLIFHDGNILDKKESTKDYYWNDGEPFWLPILGEPRYTSTEFYFKKPDEDRPIKKYTTDYYVNKNDKKKEHDAKILGRKFYWHHNDFKAGQKLDSSKNNNMTNQVRAIKSDEVFGFDIVFHNLNKKMLKQLLTTISLGNNSENLHKLGKAKPYGFGSVNIEIRNLSIKGKRAWEEESGDSLKERIGSLEEGQLKNMVRFNKKVGKAIEYPKNNGEIFKFFANNRRFNIKQWLDKDGVIKL